jgi:uncharacterized protein (DUF4415 family)
MATDKRLHPDDAPELTAELMAQMRPMKETHPETYAALMAAKRHRGPQKRPTKAMLVIRVDRAALAKFRATGKGWQTRLAATIERAAARLPRPRRSKAVA